MIEQNNLKILSKYFGKTCRRNSFCLIINVQIGDLHIKKKKLCNEISVVSSTQTLSTYHDDN